MMSDTTSISNILGLVEFVLSTGIFICSLAYLRPAKLAYKAKKKNHRESNEKDFIR
ncbi:hypothetical protein TEQUI_1485 [Taylorella equigenitalis MCE9]|uniref:Uncharacterized protein n=3 Tax=Taylorella equigenitalis TaxID=29575 RepID=A0A654KIU3_TAYEM|nr:hypothetical protein TEQUI_1485 [Taylorella equigenitalis MCE9]